MGLEEKERGAEAMSGESEKSLRWVLGGWWLWASLPHATCSGCVQPRKEQQAAAAATPRAQANKQSSNKTPAAASHKESVDSAESATTTAYIYIYKENPENKTNLKTKLNTSARQEK